MVAGAAARDPDLVAHGSARGSRGDLAVSDGVARSLEVAQRRLQAGSFPRRGVHAGGVDAAPRGVPGEGDLIPRISGLRRCPGRVGDRVVDDGGDAAEIGADRFVAVVGEHGGERLAQRLGGVGAFVSADVHGLSAHADIAVPEVVRGVCGDHGAVDAVAAVRVPDGRYGVGGVAGFGDIKRAVGDAVELILVAGLDKLHIFRLRRALEVLFVGLEGDDAVFVLHELVGPGAHGRGVFGSHGGEVALREAEAVVCVVILRRVAVVVQRSNGHAELIDRGGIDPGERHAQGVIAGLHDARDVRGTLAGLNALAVQIIVAHQRPERDICLLVLYNRGNIAAIGVKDHSPEICGSRVRRQIPAPAGGTGSDGVAGLVPAVGDDVIHDGLRERRTGLVQLAPERVLRGLGPFGIVRIVLARVDQRLIQRRHAGAVCLHADDRQRGERAAAVVGRVGQDIHREDDVVRGELLAVGEQNIVSEIKGKGDRAVRVLGDGQVRNAVVGVVCAVIGARLAGLALFHDHALTVGLQQVGPCHGYDVIVICIFGEERGKAAAQL